MNSVQLSFIIPVYNLENCIEDTLNQLISSISVKHKVEIILVNDGSTDSSDQIIEKYQVKYSFIKLINKSNGGVCSARNIGIQNAKGKYLFFLDGDDFLDRKFLDNFSSLKNKSDLIIGSRKILKKNTDELFLMENKVYKAIPFLNYVLNEKINYWNIGGYVVKKEVLTENNILFNENLESAEDLDFFMRVLKCVDTIQTTSFLFFTYMNNREGSSSLTFSNKKIKNQLSVCLELIDYFKALNVPLEFFIDKYIHIVNEAQQLTDSIDIQHFINTKKIPLSVANNKQKIHLIVLYKLGLKRYLKIKKFF